MLILAFYVQDVFEPESLPYQIFTNWIAFGEILLPLPIIMISCCVTVYQLSTGVSDIRNAEGEKTKREATITILNLTGSYIASNIPLRLIWIIISPSRIRVRVFSLGCNLHRDDENAPFCHF